MICIWRVYVLTHKGEWFRTPFWNAESASVGEFVERMARTRADEFSHVMAWPFFAMDGAALLGGETRLPVNAFRSLAHAEEQDMRGGLSCRFCYGVHAPGFECKEPG